MFPLLRYFSVASFIALAIVIAVLAYLNRQVAMQELVRTGESGNVALAQLFANSLWPRFSEYVTSDFVAGRSGDELRARPETGQIHSLASQLASNLSVLKLKIYNTDGLTVFSSEKSQIGEDKSSNAGFQAAASGTGPASKFSHRGQFSSFSGTVANRSLVETYVPIRNDAGRVEGVFELYSDVTPLVVRMEGSQINLLLWALGGAACLYAILFFIVYRADTVLRSQYAEIQASRNALTLKNNALAQAMEARTRMEKELEAARRAQAERSKHVLPVVQKMCQNIAQVFTRYAGSGGADTARRTFKEWLQTGPTGPVSVPNFVHLLSGRLPGHVDKEAFERDAMECIKIEHQPDRAAV